MTYDITPVVNALILLLSAVVTAFIIPWIRSRTGNEQLQQLSIWTSAAVEAAEQIYTGSGRGEEKKTYVLDFLTSKGLTADLDSIDAMIEAAVFNLPDDRTASIDAVGFTVDYDEEG